jgi:hypothetical protein
MKPENTAKLVFASFILLVILACNTSFTAFNLTATPVSPTLLNPTFTPVPPTLPPLLITETPGLFISQQVTLANVPFSEVNPGNNFPSYTITSQTPQLTGSNDPRVQAFNQQVNGLVTKEVDVFRQNFQQLPVTSYSNGSSLDVTYTLVSQVGDLWSFKFDIAFYSDGAAHPGSNSTTLNYDLGQGRELVLSDLFLPNSNYLEVIANYCTAELMKQPYSDSFFLDGAKPTLENYRNWNITPDGLLITFDTYQVAPGAAGPQTVVVPYSELQAVVNPQGPLAIVIP